MLSVFARCTIWGLVLLLWVEVCAAQQASSPGPAPLEPLRAAVIMRPSDYTTSYTAEDARRLEQAAQRLEQWFGERAWTLGERPPQEVLSQLGELIEIKQEVDGHLQQVLSQRTEWAGLPDDPQRAAALRQYLVMAGHWIRLAGRLNYALRDAVDTATYVLDPDLDRFAELVRLVHRERLDIGAAAMGYVLFDPPADSGASPYPDKFKSAVLELIAATRNLEMVPVLTRFLRQQGQSPGLVLRAAEVLWQLGLPQSPRPGPTLAQEAPALGATELRRLLEDRSLDLLPAAEAARRSALLAQVRRREQAGITEVHLQLGDLRLLPGDWFLMRNPSPYNHFTDLGPGLFTHVGLVAEETDATGVRRIVIVDLPERGARIPATNVEAYLAQTLHYVFLRHRDPQVRQQMAEAAASLIGNESQFDLLFDTERVEPLRGKPLRGQRIHTYCAGLLLICAQATDRPRQEFFPIVEGPPGEQCLANLNRLGMSIGDDFVSPTGPLFSPQMEVVGWREPMYEPGREVKEAVYDHFAARMLGGELQPAPDAFQQLREKVAGLSRTNEWLRLALARANNVSEHMDLESAARAAAVVETLDEIAERSLRGFEQSREAVMAASDSELLARENLSLDARKNLVELRRRHADLVQAWQQGRITPRDLRVALVDYYCAAGQRELDERFFPTAREEVAADSSNGGSE